MKRSSARHARSADPVAARASRAPSAKRAVRRARARSARSSGGIVSPAEAGLERARTKTGTGRLSTDFCRLCHGKFSTRRLRQAFGWPAGESEECTGTEPSSLHFSSDFQGLLGVPVHRDPSLSQYICKNCHTQFYKCHSILLTFRQKVNLTPSHHESDGLNRSSLRHDIHPSSPPIVSNPTCLLSLVSWAHQHAEGCHSCPGLQEVLEGQYFGSVKALWSCVDGHAYMMDTSQSQPGADTRPDVSASAGNENTTVHQSVSQPISSNAAKPTNSTTLPLTQSSTHSYVHSAGSDDALCGDTFLSPLPVLATARQEDSDLSDRNYSSEDEEFEDKRKSGSSDDSADEYADKRVGKRGNKEAKPPEPKVRRKPGPKPGWKKKIKSEREELPTIYKCPHQGCTAVYRGADGMKKHIKEHHEEVRERPCPHPGCNKVFMIDRYLQRHVKLIHTEVRNYICDQCGQTFKQRKHLSVHQMRHSGAKPLQCEVCGFQCRQRASLKYHMTKHKAEADLEFACALCGRRFEKAHNLNVHMSMVHPLMQGGSISLPPEPDNHHLQHTDPMDLAPTPTRTHTATEDMSCVLQSLHSELIQQPL